MSINQKIEHALEGITKNIWPLCCPSDSPPDCYIVYNPEIESPGYYADDKDQEWIQNMQIHLFMKGNYTKLRKEIRSTLKRKGFVVTGIETMLEKETGYYHLCFECYDEEGQECLM